jgi:transposase-like protein
VAETDLFKRRHYESEIILLCVRLYLRYALSYRALEEMMIPTHFFNTTNGHTLRQGGFCDWHEVC